MSGAVLSVRWGQWRVCLWGVSQFVTQHVLPMTDGTPLQALFSAPKSLKPLFIYQLCILGHRWHHNMQLYPSQWLSRAPQPWRCFSHVAHPMESQESTLLNQPCNWSHKMKAVHHHQEPCYIISMKLLKYNPWSCCGEVYVSQRMESWREKERKIVDY